jgi:hypothetical protein
VALVRTDVSEESNASILKVTRSSGLGTLALTSSQRLELLVTANVAPSSPICPLTIIIVMYLMINPP